MRCEHIESPISCGRWSRPKITIGSNYNKKPLSRQVDAKYFAVTDQLDGHHPANFRPAEVGLSYD
jgi:hypothetical protein